MDVRHHACAHRPETVLPDNYTTEHMLADASSRINHACYLRDTATTQPMRDHYRELASRYQNAWNNLYTLLMSA